MKKLITNKITLSIFFVIVCHLTVKAQDTAKRVIVVVRPGGATGVTSIKTTTTIPGTGTSTAAAAPASATNSSKYAAAPGSNPASSVASAQKAPVTPYVAPGSRPHTYTAPSTSERVSTASYMHKTVTPAVTTPAPAAAAPVTTGTVGGNAAKFAAAAPPAPKPATVTPAAAPVVPPAKKDTLVVSRVQKDTTDSLPQTYIGNKIVFLELGGPGLAISMNYDMRFKKGAKDGFGFRAGVGYFAAGNNTVFTVPLMVNYLYGKDGKYLEIGLGTTFLNSKGDNYSSSVWEFDDVTGFIATGLIGVRYEPNRALNFRLGYVPIIYDEGLINAGGFSIGYTF